MEPVDQLAMRRLEQARWQKYWKGKRTVARLKVTTAAIEYRRAEDWQLWAALESRLYELVADLSDMHYPKLYGDARQAQLCFLELRMRGSQLTFPLDDGSPSSNM